MGDISPLLSYAGQLRTNNSPSRFINPFDAFGAADNISQGELMKYVTKTDLTRDTSVLTNLVIDDKRLDTLPLDQALRRSPGGGSFTGPLYRNPDGTITARPKVQINTNYTTYK